MRVFRLTLLSVVLVALGAASADAQETGTITGQVLDRTSNNPLVGAQVSVVGTSRGALANQDGRFIIQDIPAGQQEIRATLIGYSTRTVEVVVPPGGTVNQNIQLTESAIQLGAVVVTATGQEQTKREIGSSVGVINMEDVDVAPVTSFSDLIQGRSSGTVVLQTSGVSGAGSRIRIRGSNSISLSNSPLLVIDGVRVESNPSLTPLGGGSVAPSALDDLNPENIESIEILKGPAASALYGTAAANGVIQVTTKKGRAGEARIHVWTEANALDVTADFPANVQAYDESFSTQVPCPLMYQAAYGCVPDVTYEFNPLENEETTPFERGTNLTFGASASGGGEDATYFLSAERSEEESVYYSQNFIDRWNLQANMTGRIGSTVNVRGTVGLVETDAQYPLTDLSTYGVVSMGLYANALPQTVEENLGYRFPLEFFETWQTWQNMTRITASAAADWAPLEWLNINGSAGVDRLRRDDESRLPRPNPRAFAPNGLIQLYERDNYNVNTNLSGSAVFNLAPALVSTTTLGSQYIREDANGIYAVGWDLIPGVEESLAGATTNFDASEYNILNATVSAYVQQQFAFADRLFLNAAVRGDQNTAFGTDIGWIWYPSISGAWVISDEDFFPDNDFLDELRLRAAYGQAGLRPGATDALQSFAGVVANAGTVGDVPAIVINEIGNPELEPERTTEYEFGFDTNLLSGRLGLEATYFNKKSEDALINRPLPLSPGGSANRFENLGEVRNSGLEFAINGQAVRNQTVEWNIRFGGSFIENELVDLGEDAEGNPIPPISGLQAFVEGYPLGGYWDQPIQDFEDVNGDGLIGPDEVVVGVYDEEGQLHPDSVAYFGTPLPTRELSLGTNVTLWDLVRVSALFDHKGGHTLGNYTAATRCASYLNCAEAFDENLSLERQAEIVARTFPPGTYAGFFEDATFTKLRELSLTFMLPDTWTQHFKASDLRLTLAGRNLVTWTDYSGLDPEVNYGGQANFTTGDYTTLPPNRVLTVRLDANF